MSPFAKHIDPPDASPRVLVLAAVTQHPGMTTVQVASHVGIAYSTTRTSLRVLRNDGKVRQRVSNRKANAGWEPGRDDAYLGRMKMDIASDPTAAAFVAFRDPMHAFLFGPAKQPE